MSVLEDPDGFDLSIICSLIFGEATHTWSLSEVFANLRRDFGGLQFQVAVQQYPERLEIMVYPFDAAITTDKAKTGGGWGKNKVKYSC